MTTPASRKRIASTVLCPAEFDWMHNPQLRLDAVNNHINKQLEGTGVTLHLAHIPAAPDGIIMSLSITVPLPEPTPI